MTKKIRTHNLFSSSALYLIANIVNAIIPFLLLPILTRYLSQNEYGKIALFQTFIGAIATIIGIGTDGVAGRKFYDSQISSTEYKYFIGNCFKIILITTTLSLFLILAFDYELSIFFNVETQWLLIGTITAGASFVIMIRLGQWQVRKNPKNYGIFQITQSLFNMLFSLLFVFYFSKGADGRILVLAFTPLIFAAMAIYLLYKDDLIGFAYRPEYFKEILRFGLPLIPHSVGTLLLFSIDRFIVTERLGMAQLGVYMVAVQLVAVMSLIFGAINNAFVPWLFELLAKNNIEDKAKIVRLTYCYFLLLFGLVGISFFIGPPILTLIAGEKYSAATDIIGWLVLGQAFGGMYLMVTNYIFYSKRTAFLSLTTIVVGIINICLTLILIEFMGLKGVSISFAISMGLHFFITWFFSNKVFPMPWFNFKLQY